MFLWSSVAAKALSLSAGAAAFTQSSQGLLVATVIIISMTMPAPQVSRGVILVPCCDGTLAPQVSHGIPTMFQFLGQLDLLGHGHIGIPGSLDTLSRWWRRAVLQLGNSYVDTGKVGLFSKTAIKH